MAAELPDPGITESPTEDIETLARTHTAALRRFFERRILEQSDVDDLIQEVFLRIARRGLGGITHLQGYLFETASNVLKDRLRHRIRHRSDHHQEIDDNLPQDVAFTPERVLLGREAVRRVAAALKELPERTRAVFLLRRYDGLSFKEIAHRLGVSVSSIEKHMARAVIAVAECMKDDDE